MFLRTTRRCALGNGRREAGKVLAEIEPQEDVQVQDIIKAALFTTDVTELPADVMMADGVEPKEIITALRSLNAVCELVDEDLVLDQPVQDVPLQEVLIADLDIPKKVKAALAKAGFTCVGDLDEVEDITSIPGVGEDSESQLADAIRTLQTK